MAFAEPALADKGVREGVRERGREGGREEGREGERERGREGGRERGREGEMPHSTGNTSTSG